MFSGFSNVFRSNKKLTIHILEKIHNRVYSKPYDFDPIDWLAAYLRDDDLVKRTHKRFFCSALVAFIYTQAEILDKNTNCTMIRPGDFAEGDKHLKWNEESHLEGFFRIK